MRVEVNGKVIEVGPEEEGRSLLEFLREELDLTGAKDGCGAGFCGACTVLLDSQPVKACNMAVRDAAGKDVLTIEGLSPLEGPLHPLQQAFIDAGAIQCGFCTPGMVLAAHAFLTRNSRPTRPEIRRAINPNLCRCTGYQQIIDAVEAAAPHYRRA